MFGIDSSNSLPIHAMFSCLEDGSWFMWKMHQYTPAKHILAKLNVRKNFPPHARSRVTRPDSSGRLSLQMSNDGAVL